MNGGIHTRVSNFWDIGHEEQKGKQEHEYGDGKIDPLHIFQCTLVTKGEEDIGAQDGGNDGADAVEGLGNIDSYLGVSWRTAHCRTTKLDLTPPGATGPGEGRCGTGSPVMYGFAAVSSDPRPLPMMKMQAQKPPKL